MTPTEALATIPEEVPQHSRAYPRKGWVRTVDQVACLERAKSLIEAVFGEIAVGEIEGDRLSVAIDHIDASINDINERLAEREEQACTCRARAVRPTDLEPPPVVLNHDCPIHGIDPDRARDEWLERRRNA